MTPRCATCRFWIMDNPGMASGSCRRRSPLPADITRLGTLDLLEHMTRALYTSVGINPDDVGDLSPDVSALPASWPKTWDSAWCGEYEAIG